MQMKTKPILFSAPMVRAILNGRKTQTRRVVDMCGRSQPPRPPTLPGRKWIWPEDDDHPKQRQAEPSHGVPGDVLWVRETWRTLRDWDHLPPSLVPKDSEIFYEADEEPRLSSFVFGKVRQAIFMPRWASRIQLRIINLRVERLHDISHSDALREGVEGVGAFADLWDSINEHTSWDENPWVWSIEFELHRIAGELQVPRGG